MHCHLIQLCLQLQLPIPLNYFFLLQSVPTTTPGFWTPLETDTRLKNKLFVVVVCCVLFVGYILYL